MAEREREARPLRFKINIVMAHEAIEIPDKNEAFLAES